MQRILQKFCLCLAFTGSAAIFSPANAQLLSTNNLTSGGETTKQTELKQNDWSIFTDNENRLAYIDFEKINVNLSGLTVKNTEGDVVFKDDALWQLPVNTIYEVDFSKYPKGEYTIELKSFTATINKKVTVK